MLEIVDGLVPAAGSMSAGRSWRLSPDGSVRIMVAAVLATPSPRCRFLAGHSAGPMPAQGRSSHTPAEMEDGPCLVDMKDSSKKRIFESCTLIRS